LDIVRKNDIYGCGKDNAASSNSSPGVNNTTMEMDDDTSLKLSVKLGALLRHLNQLRQGDSMMEKCVVFSQL